jgi:hypothetical protein
MTGPHIIECRDALKANRNPLIGHWDELSSLFMPFRTMEASGLPDLLAADEIFDSTSRRAALILANGLASLVTPREEVWFEYQPPRSLRQDDDAVRFYRQASEVAREFIEASNFYEEIQECYIDSPVYGTTALFCGDLDDAGGLYFRTQPVKSYYIAEDAKGRVNTFYRDLHLTADQAAGEFGAEALPAEVRGKVGTSMGKTEQFEFVHAVYQRTTPADPDAPENQRKPWVSMVVFARDKSVVQESGYEEFPFAVHRYRRFGRCVWGFGPGSIAKGDVRQLNFLNELADVATEKSVFPPVIAPSSLEGEVAMGALEITYVDPTDPNAAAMLREWAPSTRYDIAKDRMGDKRNQIEQAFHVDLFQLFAARAMERAPMTATEANLVAGEKLTQFSPVFGRLVSEMLDPVLARVFGVLLRAGQFPQPPESVTLSLRGDRRGVALPSVEYKNRIMLAMQARRNGSLLDYMNLAQPILMVYPQAVDALNLPTIVRDTARNAGLPEEWIRSKKELAEIEAQRAESAAAQEQLAMADAAAGVAKKVGETPPDVRNQLAQAMQM